MAESLLLKGVKDVVNRTTTTGTFDLRVKQNLRGGDVFQIKQWWNKKGNNTVYNQCTIFEIAGSEYTIIIPTSSSTQLGIIYDDDIYNIGFTHLNEVERAAVFKGGDLVIEYLFPAISGGTIAKRILQVAETIGSVSVGGEASISTLNVGKTYTATITGGDATNVDYQWTRSGPGVVLNEPTDQSSVQAVFTADGTYTLTCTVTDENAGNSPVVATKEVIVSATTIGTVSVSGDGTSLTSETKTYTASITGDAADAVYAWTVVNGNGTVPAGSAASKAITFTGSGNETVRCDVTSATSSDSPQFGTKAVVISPPISFGTGSITGSTSITADTETQYTADWSGNAVAADNSYSWSVTSPASGFILGATSARTCTFEASAGTYSLQCVVTNGNITDGGSPLTITTTITVS